MTLLPLVVAGAAGAALRYLVDRGVAARAGERWPWGTFAVNVTGCFAAGLLAGHRVLTAGLVGAYTTFSTYAVEIVKVDAERSRAAAAAYALGSLGLGVLAAGLGLALGR